MTRLPRVRKWLRRLGIGALAFFLLVTLASYAFNLAMRPPQQLDPGFGDYVDVGASSVHYERWGDHGSPIVLLPGFMESAVAWSAVGPILGEHHRVYAVDLPGPGYTRYDGPMTLAAQADLVDGFMGALRLQGALLVGHSMGAAVVGAVALAHRDDVGGVVFADGDGLPIATGPRWVRAAILDSPYVTSLLRLGAHWPWAARRAIASLCASSCPAATHALAEQWVRPLGQRSDERALHDLMLRADNGLTPAQLAGIAVPTSIIWGTRDHDGGSLRATVDNLHHPPVHLITGAGHLTMLADPDAFATAVESAAASG